MEPTNSLRQVAKQKECSRRRIHKCPQKLISWASIPGIAIYCFFIEAICTVTIFEENMYLILNFELESQLGRKRAIEPPSTTPVLNQRDFYWGNLKSVVFKITRLRWPRSINIVSYTLVIWSWWIRISWKLMDVVFVMYHSVTFVCWMTH